MTPLVFLDIPIQLYFDPQIDGRPRGFYHLVTEGDSGDEDRPYDGQRIRKILWPKAFIENYECADTCCNDKPLCWKTMHSNNKFRYKILFKDYTVILEKRDDYFLLITAYPLNHDHTKRKLLKEYNNANTIRLT